jgi:hypothetical protein
MPLARAAANEIHGSPAMRDSKGKSRKQQKESLKAHGERLDSKKAPTMLKTEN